MIPPPQLLIEWSSPWREFWLSVRPALRRSPPRLRMETRAGLFPARGMLLAFLVEVAALASLMARPTSVLPPEALETPPPSHDVIYFTADELPRTDDLAGGPAGRHGMSGGDSVQHPSQTIRVARDKRLNTSVADAPALQLPKSESEISNLLAYKASVPVAPPQPIKVSSNREKQRDLEQTTAAPSVALPRDAMPRLPEAHVVPAAPPPVAAPLRVSRERAKLELPASTSAPSVTMAREQLPDLPQSNLTPKSGPTPIQVARARRRAVTDSAAQAPTVAMITEQMPNLPQANVTVKAPPTPIQVARSRQKIGFDSPAPVAPKMNSLTGREQRNLASVVSAPQVNLPAAPAESKAAAVIVSPNPGNKAAVPKDQQKATVAMQHDGGRGPGSGGTGGGSGMQPGKGTGNSVIDANAGATAEGKEKGTDLYARNGTSPNIGPGGAGNMSSGKPNVPGVSVSGGRNSITLPSFGGPQSATSPGKSEIAKNMGTGITVIASPRAGGALNLYGALKGDRVYTIYITTRLGTAIMQFADPNSVGHESLTALTAPRVLRADVAGENAGNGHPPRVLISCQLDEQGIVRNAHVLQTESSDFASKMLAALPSWKFTPAFRGSQAVAVNAIVGFGVDTN